MGFPASGKGSGVEGKQSFGRQKLTLSGGQLVISGPRAASSTPSLCSARAATLPVRLEPVVGEQQQSAPQGLSFPL